MLLAFIAHLRAMFTDPGIIREAVVPSGATNKRKGGERKREVGERERKEEEEEAKQEKEEKI